MDKFLKRVVAALAAVVLLLSSGGMIFEAPLSAKAYDDYTDTSDYLFDDNIIGETDLFAYSLDEFVLDSQENYYDYYRDDNDHNDGPDIEYDNTVYNITSVESSDTSVVGVSTSESGGWLLTAREPGIAVITVFHYGEVQNQDPSDELLYIGNYAVFTIDVSNVPHHEVDFPDITDKAYTGSAIEPAFKLTYKNRTLIENEDYFLEYTDNVKVGTATITATLTGYYDGVITEQFRIVPTIDKKELTVYYGTKPKLTVKSSQGVTWKSGNPSVAKVVGGVIYPQSEGTATITATSGGYNLSCKVTVKKRQLSEAKKVVYAGEKFSLQYLGGTGTVTWKTANNKIAKVNSKGTVTTLAPGKVVITGTRNGVKRTCTLYVLDQKLSKSKAAIYVGKYTTLSLEGAIGKVTWKTSNSKIVAVNQKGLIKGKKPGKAVITAVHNGKQYQCVVTVVDQKLNATKLSLNVGKSATLTLKGATAKVTWKTSNSKIAAVNQKGLVLAKKKGTAVVSAVHNGKTYKCTVTVK